jgi:hypothetical protein
MSKYKYDDYEYFAKFIRTIKNPDGHDFIEGELYPILGENYTNYYVQSRDNTNKVAEFPKETSYKYFIVVDELGNEI